MRLCRLVVVVAELHDLALRLGGFIALRSQLLGGTGRSHLHFRFIVCHD